MSKRRIGWILGACALLAVLSAGAFLIARRAEPAAQAQRDTVSLSFWTVNERYANYMLASAERFNEAAEGEKIDLEVQVYSRSFIVDQVSKSLFNDSQAPDLVDIQFNDLNKFVSGREHALLLYPLDSLISGEAEMRDVALRPFAFNDTLLAVPYGAGRLAVFYNRELLGRYGIDPRALTTWDAFFAAGDSLRAVGGPSLFALDVINNDLFYAMMLQSAPETANASTAEILASAAFSEVRILLTEALRSGVGMVPDEFDIYNQQFYAAFQSGKCLSVIAPVEYANEFLANMPGLTGKVTATALPSFSEGDPGVLVAQYGTAITSKCRNIPLAKEFLRFAKLGERAYLDMTDALLVESISESPATAAGRSIPYFSESPLEAAGAGTEGAGLVGASGLPEAVLSAVPGMLEALDP